MSDDSDVRQASGGERVEPAQESGGADWLLWALPLGMVIAMVVGTAVLFLR